MLVAIPSLPQKHKTFFNRALVAIGVVGPLISVFVAIWQSWNKIIGPLEIILLIVFYLAIAFGVTVGLHRLFTHESFKSKPIIRWILGILALMALEGTIISWVANHKMHHAFSDQEEDLHSPAKGFLHAHIGWFFRDKEADPTIYAKHLLNDPIVTILDRWAVFIGISSVVLPFIIAGWQGLLWAGLVRIFLVHHFTWSINSICHIWGSQPYRTPMNDKSGNVFWLLPSLGENYHNTHHAFQNSARHGTNLLNDPSWALIWFLQKLGLVWDAYVPSPETMEKRRV